ncbi:MAG: nicotinamide-nucleotide amidohydrolase family protein, partial [Solirubrobacterales bacterium]
TTCLRRGAELEIDVRYRTDAEPLREALFDGLRKRHSDYIYTERGESIDELVAGLLSGHRIGFGESCSGGKLAARLTDRPGSSDYVAGGVVAYSNEAKVNLLGIPAETIAAHGAVSAEVAEALAGGAMERFDADLGVGITGVAGPGGGTKDKPVGYVCICVRSANGRMLAREPQLPGNRDDVRDRSVSVAMHMIRRLLLAEDLPF